MNAFYFKNPVILKYHLTWPDVSFLWAWGCGAGFLSQTDSHNSWESTRHLLIPALDPLSLSGLRYVGHPPAAVAHLGLCYHAHDAVLLPPSSETWQSQGWPALRDTYLLYIVSIVKVSLFLLLVSAGATTVIIQGNMHYKFALNLRTGCRPHICFPTQAPSPRLQVFAGWVKPSSSCWTGPLVTHRELKISP